VYWQKIWGQEGMSKDSKKLKILGIALNHILENPIQHFFW